MKEGARGGTVGSSAQIRLARPSIGSEELDEVAEVLESGQLTMGPKVVEFERLIAEAAGTPHAVAVSSGTAALHLSVLALGFTEDDEVIVPAYTFPATANTVTVDGAQPVLVDVDPVTMNLDVDQVAAALTPRTRGVIGVHLFGRPMDWEALQDAVPDDIPMIEDAAGALGARRRGRSCGSLGTLGCFSFHPRKTVTTGEGGAVTTFNDDEANAIREARNHGWRPPDNEEMAVPGLNYRLSDILCAVGIPQLRRLDELLSARERLADGYAERLGGVEGIVLPGADEGDRHGWQAYVVQVDGRDEILTALRAQGIEAQIGTYALHRLAAYRDQGDFPGADAAFARALALPFHTELSDGELDRVAEALTALVSN